MKKMSGGKFANIGSGEKVDDRFWDRHPVLRSLYLGFKGIRKIPRFMLKIPRMLFRIAFPAAYAGSGENAPIGADFVSRMLGKVMDNPVFKTAYENYRKFMKFPGVSLAMSILGPVFGVNRMAEGLVTLKKGQRTKNARKVLDGKVDIMTGALATIKPLALFAILTEGVHLFLDWRVRKHGMDPQRADQIMTNIFAAVSAPIGLAAYALLSPREPEQK